RGRLDTIGNRRGASRCGKLSSTALPRSSNTTLASRRETTLLLVPRSVDGSAPALLPEPIANILCGFLTLAKHVQPCDTRHGWQRRDRVARLHHGLSS